MLQIYSLFKRLFQKYDRSRQHWSSKSQDMNGLTNSCQQESKSPGKFINTSSGQASFESVL